LLAPELQDGRATRPERLLDHAGRAPQRSTLPAQDSSQRSPCAARQDPVSSESWHTRTAELLMDRLCQPSCIPADREPCQACCPALSSLRNQCERQGCLCPERP